MPNMLIAHEDGENLKITGMVDVADDLKELVGTSRKAKEVVLEKNAGANLERALVDGLCSAREVFGGYVKFAKPIVLKGMVLPRVVEKLAAMKTATTSTAMKVDDLPITPKIEIDTKFMSDLEQLLKHAAANDLEKAAACPFVENWLQAREDLKVEGNDVGLDAPCKVSFATSTERDFFVGLFKKKAGTFSIDELAGQLVSDGLVKGGVVERLAAAGVKKHAQDVTTRRKVAASKS